MRSVRERKSNLTVVYLPKCDSCKQRRKNWTRPNDDSILSNIVMRKAASYTIKNKSSFESQTENVHIIRIIYRQTTR